MINKTEVINKQEVIELIESYIDYIDKNLEYYFNINEEQITKEEEMNINDIVRGKIMQQSILYSLMTDIEEMS